jgi:hypothetical protein
MLNHSEREHANVALRRSESFERTGAVSVMTTLAVNAGDELLWNYEASEMGVLYDAECQCDYCWLRQEDAAAGLRIRRHAAIPAATLHRRKCDRLTESLIAAKKAKQAA